MELKNIVVKLEDMCIFIYTSLGSYKLDNITFVNTEITILQSLVNGGDTILLQLTEDQHMSEPRMISSDTLINFTELSSEHLQIITDLISKVESELNKEYGS